ncbi:hypothetical protein DFP79_0762 [Marinomonas balearica]|uniref:Uncharacterized protein n=1 Tax=Marinomonas balearica TaxID=491947 RepID=A0A4R6MHU8_9GAMM|nr:hypothetical protein DFP79_0762 [Marinomonas balearica]
MSSFFLIFFSIGVFADDIDQYRYYQTDQILPKRKSAHYIVYIKNNDPCIYTYNLREKKTVRFCEMGDSGLNLERNYPSIYPVDLTLRLGGFDFKVAAPWSEQKCQIYFPRMKLTCEPTGN